MHGYHKIPWFSHSLHSSFNKTELSIQLSSVLLGNTGFVFCMERDIIKTNKKERRLFIMNKQDNLIVGMCVGRHAIPGLVEEDYIFPNTIEDPFDLQVLDQMVEDKLDGAKSVMLYVTGLTVCLGAVVKHCSQHNVHLTLMHFNVATGSYVAQEVL